MKALGPNVKNQPMGTKGISWSVEDVYEKLKKLMDPLRMALEMDVQILAMLLKLLKLFSCSPLPQTESLQ